MLSAKEPIKVVPKVFLRDTGFYMLGPIILIIAALTGELSVPYSVTLLVVYVIFVIVVVIGDKLDKSRVRAEEELTIEKFPSAEESVEKAGEKIQLLEEDSAESDKKVVALNKTRSADVSEHYTQILDEASFHQDSIKDDHFEDHFGYMDDQEETRDATHQAGFANSFKNTKHKVLWSLVKMNRFMKKTVQAEDPWHEMNWLQKIVYIFIDAPFDFIRRITIPPSNEENWDRRFAMVTPVGAIIFFFLVSGMIDFSGPPHFVFYILLGLGAVFSIVIYYTTKQQHAPQKLIILYALLAFLMALVWIWWVANILIDLLSLFGVIFDIKAAFLGITVLAWGNSVGDMMANSAVAKKGFARMAITGCIAGPLFNLFFGLGISLVKESIAGNVSKFTFHSTQSILPTVCGA